MLPMDHVEGLVETIRVFGNLTHFKEIRDILTRKEGKCVSKKSCCIRVKKETSWQPFSIYI